MQTNQSVSISTRIVQVCLFLAAAIAIFGGSLQMYLGEPTVSARLDNIHRFMAGIYLSMGLICFWAAYTIRVQRTLVYLIALGIFIAALGRILSISIVGLPEPAGLWIGYLTPEILLPIILAIAQSRRKEIQ
ncbi:DUF4345 domain-containing protein [Leptospira koniambonensis]|uniref:DUF4345 domain-containing protein n=1 Tax=Leptospira koniambonensis TaxID=2484950 RepID=A0A4R9J1D5_9LEPT|nr:DUF4345 domain-containing protein [Leptospira koniambonensis]TGL28204.1 DUF4345 domain-containing protein [Leptospira koniambonensis]